MTRKDFQKLAGIRLKEAETLLEHGHFEGCYYLSGYVVEFALKACIAKKTNRHDFPDMVLVRRVFTHDLAELLKLAGLSDPHSEEVLHNPEFQVNWYAVNDWREQSRYETPDEDRARQIFRAVADKKNGVLRWLKHYW